MEISFAGRINSPVKLWPRLPQQTRWKVWDTWRLLRKPAWHTLLHYLHSADELFSFNKASAYSDRISFWHWLLLRLRGLIGTCPKPRIGFACFRIPKRPHSLWSLRHVNILCIEAWLCQLCWLNSQNRSHWLSSWMRRLRNLPVTARCIEGTIFLPTLLHCHRIMKQEYLAVSLLAVISSHILSL